MLKEFFTVKRLVRGAMIAAVYAVLTLVLAPISFGPMQLRVSEALCVLPLLLPEAIPALFIGCFLSNVFAVTLSLSALGAADIIFGSLFSLIAAFLTWKLRKKSVFISLLPPVLVNAFGLAALFYFLTNTPFWATALWIALGQAAAVYVIGIPLLVVFKKFFGDVASQ